MVTATMPQNTNVSLRIELFVQSNTTTWLAQTKGNDFHECQLLASAAVAALLAAAPAQADGLYIGAFGGVNFLDDATGSADIPNAPGGVAYTVEVENERGWAAGGAIGYGFEFGLRAEAE